MGFLFSKPKSNDSQVKHSQFNIAVAGQAGVGKSCFINAIRNVKRGEQGFAEEDVVETTKDPTPYVHPQFPNLVLWDLPGIGTQMFPKNGYDKKIKFQTYDFFLILSSQRFTENDIWLAEKVKKTGKSFYYVRTQIDIDVFKRNDLQENDVIEKVRSDCVKRLEMAKFHCTEDSLFLINNKDTSAYDFQKLNAALFKHVS